MVRLRFSRALLVVSLILASAFSLRAETWNPADLAGKDLRPLNFKQPELFEPLRRALPLSKEQQMATLHPWRILRTPARDAERYLVFWGTYRIRIPSEAPVRVTVVDAMGKRLWEQEFSGGWRVHVNDAELITSPGGHPVLKVISRPVINGPGIAAQYYAIEATGLRLVRLESKDGTLHHNFYDWPNHHLGPDELIPTVRECVTALGGSEVEALAALTLLEGQHRDPEDRREASPHVQSKADAQKARSLYDASTVKAAVTALTSSPLGR